MIICKNKKNTTQSRFVAGFLLIILVSSFLFNSPAQAAGENYNKIDGSLLPPAEWNNLVNDFVKTWSTATMAGPLGIGTASPAAAFDVFGKIKINSTGTIYNVDSNRYLDMTGIMPESLKVSGNLYSTAGALKIDGTGNSYIMGNLGIGTTVPGVKLNVSGSILYNNRAMSKVGDADAGNARWVKFLTVSIDNPWENDRYEYYIKSRLFAGTLMMNFGSSATADSNNISNFKFYTDYNLGSPLRFVYYKASATTYDIYTYLPGYTSAYYSALYENKNGVGWNVGSVSYSGVYSDPPAGYVEVAYSNNSIPDGVNGQTLRYNGTGWLANSLLYNNGTNIGIGSTAPAYKLDVAGTAQFTNAIIVGTPTAINHATTKSYVDSALTGGSGSAVGYWTMNGANIYSNNSGNVGIGTNSPGRKLDVRGDVAIGAGADSSGLKLRMLDGITLLRVFDPTNNGNVNSINFGAVGSGGDLRAHGTNILFLNSAGTPEYMRITSAGNVGIGTTNPLDALSVAGKVSIGGGAVNQFGVLDIHSTSTTGASRGIVFSTSGGNTQLALFGVPGADNQYASGSVANTDFVLRTIPATGRLLYAVGASGNVAMSILPSSYVGIGTTSPLFKLDVSGTAQFNNTVIVGTPTAANHATTKSYVDSAAMSAANSFWTANGANIYNSNSGNVGIGITNPSEKLVVSNGNLQLSGNMAVQWDSNNHQIYSTGSGQNNMYFKEWLGNFHFVDGNGNVERLTITNGNVGIGTTNPLFKLDVNGTAQFNNAVIVGTPTAPNHATTKSYVDSAAGGGVGAGTSGQTLRNNGTSWVANSTLYNNGTNVGIGTTNPGATLDISSGNFSGGTSPTIKIGADIGATTRTDTTRKLGSITQVPYNIANPSYVVYAGDSASAYNAVNIGGGFAGYNSATYIGLFTGATTNTLGGTERMRIDNTGNVGIGTTVPAYKLDVNGTAQFNNSVIVGTPTAANHATTKSYVDSALSGGSGSTVGYWSMNGANIYNSNSGNVGVGTTNPTSPLHIKANLADGVGIFRVEGTEPDIMFNDTDGGFNTFTFQNAGNSLWAFGRNGSDNFYITRKDGAGLFVDNTFVINRLTGNVGIGTTDPSYRLDVLSPNTIDAFVRSQRQDTTTPVGFTMANGTTNVSYMYMPPSSSDIRFYTGGDRLSILNSNGNVGIGTTNPGYKLHIETTSGGLIRLNTTESTTWIPGINATAPNMVSGQNMYFAFGKSESALNNASFSYHHSGDGSTSNYGAFGMNGLPAVSIAFNGAGNVGIGTNAPTGKLEIKGSSTTTPAFRLAPNSTYGWNFYERNDNGDLDIKAENNNIESNVLYLKRSNGYIGIGTSAPAHKLDVSGTAQFSNTVIVGTPTASNHATTKSYVDSAITSGNATLLDNIDSSRFIYGQNGSGSNNASTTQNVFELAQYKSGFWDTNASTWAPTTDWYWGATFAHTSNSTGYNYSGQLAFKNGGGGNYIYARTINGGTPTIWSRLLSDTSDVNSSGNLRITGSGNHYISSGNLGIGSTIPAYKLDVAGTAQFNNSVIVGTPTAANHAATKSYVDSAAGGGVGAGTSGQTLRHNGTSWIANSTLYNNGTNIGIGTVSPDDKLHVSGDAHIAGNAYSSKIVVNPTSGIGWYRIVSVGAGGGTAYILAGMDNRQSRLEFNYNIRSYISDNNGVGQVTVLRSFNYNNGPISQIRIGADSVAGNYSAYLDIYVNSATTPVAFTVYGTNGAAFLASPIYNPATPTYSQTIDLAAASYSGIFTSRNLLVGGNVGIGSATPAYKLDVAGTAQFNNAVIVGTPTAANHATTKSYVDSAAMSAANSFWTANGANIYNSNSGNVGIGTTSPLYKLDIVGPINVTNGYSEPTAEIGYRIKFADNGGINNDSGIGLSGSLTNENLWINKGSANGSIRFMFGTAGEKVTFTATGNIGIGTTAPSYRLDVLSPNTIDAFVRSQRQDTTTPVGFTMANGATNVSYMYMPPSSSDIRFYTGGDRLSILNSNGNVGIGTTTPSEKLEVSGNLKISGNYIRLQGNNTGGIQTRITNDSEVNGAYSSFFLKTGTQSGFEFYKYNAANSTYPNGVGINNYDNGPMFFGTSNITRMTILGGGNVGIGTTAPSAKLDVLGSFRVSGALNSVVLDRLSGTGNRIVMTDSSGSLYATSSDIASGLPSAGDLGSTLYSNGSKWTATTNLYSNGTNVGIGTTTPLAKLHISVGQNKDVYIGNGGAIGAPDLSVLGASVLFTRTTTQYADSGIAGYTSVAGGNNLAIKARSDVVFVSGNSNDERMRIKELGNVGIGTTAPSYRLDVLSPNTIDAFVRSQRQDTTTPVGFTMANGTTNASYMYMPPSSSDIRFYTGGDRLSILNSNGNVGIGTTVPNQQLEITKNFRLPSTTGTTPYGIIYKDGNRFIHDFNYGNNGTVTTSGGNTFIGLNAGNFTMGSTATLNYHASYNTVVGNNAFYSNTLGAFNTISGQYAAHSNTTGTNNSTYGYNSLGDNASGGNNTAIGANSLVSNITGNNAVAIGSESQRYANSTTTPFTNTNTSVGFQALRGGTDASLNTGNGNSAFGFQTLLANTSGGYNTANGYASLYSNTSGNNNTALGYYSLFYNTTGSNNVAIGYNSLRANTAGNNNIALGLNALYNTTASSNTAIGYSSLFSNTSGGSNTALGFYAGYYLANGTTGRTTGNNGLYLGTHTKASTDGTDNETVIGYNAIGAGTNSVVLGNDSVTKTILKGTVSVGTPINPEHAATKSYVDSAAMSAANSFWTANGANIYNSNSGSVGIGTANPHGKLEINGGNIQLYNYGADNQTNTLIASINAQIKDRTEVAGMARINFLTDTPYYKGAIAFLTNDNDGTNQATPPTEKMRITPAGNIGIGTVTPAAKLDIWGSLKSDSGNLSTDGLANITAESFSDRTNVLYKLDPSNTGTSLNVAGGIAAAGAGNSYIMGNLGLGTTNPSPYKLYVNGSAYISGSLTFAASSTLSIPGGNLTVNKLTVNTIDPLYNIKGTNYSTFAPSIVGGVKEEVTGKLKISKKTASEYQTVIDFSKETIGSDLWVWYNVIDFSEANVEAFITPYGSFANVYYTVSGNQIIFHADRPTEISYRLLAKRHDWREWPTKAHDQQEKAGFIIK